MLREVITLDASMTVSSSLDRLARYGLWLDSNQSEARAWINENAGRLNLSFDETEHRLARDPRQYGAAIRRQWYANILWYAQRAEDVLNACINSRPEDTLLEALGLHEHDSRSPLDVRLIREPGQKEGVVLDGDVPVAVSLPGEAAEHLGDKLDESDSEAYRGPSSPGTSGTFGSRGTRGAQPGTEQKKEEVRAWPRLDAPKYVPARVSFDVTVGLAQTQQTHVTGGEIVLSAPAGSTSIDVTVELIADGVDAIDGWKRQLHVDVHDSTSAVVTFQLVGHEPVGPEPVHLTTIEARYVLGGAVCGIASCPLVIGRSTAAELSLPTDMGAPWLAQPATVSPIDLRGDAHVADLTIELAKPDRNGADGSFACWLRSPHPIAFEAGPHPINLGHDAKTFAKSIVERIRQFSGDPIVDNLLASVGELVAEKLPTTAFEVLRQIAKRVAPAPPAVLIVSAEPYVPWELARMEPPLDTARPPYLGAQVLVGRWLRDGTSVSSQTSTPDTAAPLRIEKPPAEPPARIAVRHMAVMAGMYKAESGLRRLPAAEQEASTLVQNYDAVPLAASTQALKQLLDARLEHYFQQIGPADAVHFAGHGEFDPSRPDASVLFLSDGRPLSAFLFRSAKYGGDRQPLVFWNACMIGIGGELLGAMGGFPGNCLRGGFGGVLGALWEIDDSVAAQVAIEFWSRALPEAGGSGEPVGEILRDLRAKYLADATQVPQATYLSYVYYGHPRLTLERMPLT